MKNIKNLVFVGVLLAVLVFTPAAFAQTATPRTYLTTAIGDTTSNIVAINSATGVSASTNAIARFILIDSELMKVTAVSSTTLTVLRAQGGLATKHLAGVPVAWGTVGNWNATTGNSTGVFLAATSANPTGTCVAANNEYLPLYRVSSLGAEMFTCATVGVGTGTTAVQWQRTLLSPGPSFGSTAFRVVSADTTALITDDVIAVASLGASVTRYITLPCSSVPAGKTWRIFDATMTAGTSNAAIAFNGLIATTQITTGGAGLTFMSDGTNCFRVD